MQIALQAGSGHADGMGVEVVARGEADVPPFAKPHVAADVERLREHVGIAHGVVIELGDVGVLAHGDAVTKGERPRHGERHVAVIVGLGLCRSFILACIALPLNHRVVDIRFDVGVDTFSVFMLAQAIVFVLWSTSEEMLELLGREGERNVLRHALKAAYLAHAPIGVCADVGMAIGIKLVGIGRKDGVEVERVVLPPLQTKIDAEATPRTQFLGHVVGHAEAQVVDDANLLDACRILIRLDFHFDVVIQ